MTEQIDKLMGSDELLEAIWSKKSRPNQEWLRHQARAFLKDNTQGIPCRKIGEKKTGKTGGRFFFIEAEVRRRLKLTQNGKV